MSSQEKQIIELQTQINIHKAIEEIQTKRLDAVKAYKAKLDEIASKTKNGQLKDILNGVTNTLEDCLKLSAN